MNMVFLRVSVAALSAFSCFARESGCARRVVSSRLAKRSLVSKANRSFLPLNIPRGGDAVESSGESKRHLSSKIDYVKHANPAPGSPFHLALPVHDLEVAKEFYGNVLGCAEGRSSEKWQDYSLNGHQIVCHWAGNDYRCTDYYNPVDGDEIPVPHFGLAMTEEEFHALADRLKKAGINFIVEPHLRFKGQPGEQWTMFFKDPSGNNLEFKAMTNIENLFAKYNVVD
jgi:extradiol dioxygenase family protein